MLLLIFASFVAFAFGYNVGDPHVFFLGSHFVIALLFASGLVAAQLTVPSAVRSSIALAGIALASWNLYQNYPALDRSRDVRPTEVLRSFTDGLHEQNALLLSDLNWQVQNGLTYFGQHVRPELLHARPADIFLYAPVFVRDNLAIGRQVMATERAALQLEAGYGPLFTIKPDPGQVMLPSLEEVVRQLPPGSRYVLSVPEADTRVPARRRPA